MPQKRKYRKEIDNLIQQIIRKYQPEKIILFGSFAYGKPGKNSDVDLAIIKKTKDKFTKRLLEVAKLIDSPLATDILVYTPEEFQRELKIGEFIFEDINKKGKILYEKK